VADSSVLTNELSRLLVRWRETEGKIRLYGPSMPQSKQIIEDFHRALEEVLTTVPSFSMVRTTNGVEIITHDTASRASHTQTLEVSDKSLQTRLAFEKFNIQSLTFKRGLTLTELAQFFCALHASPGSADHAQGLAGYFNEHSIQHIELDKIRVKILNGGQTGAKQKELTQEAEKVLHDLLGRMQQEQGRGVTGGKKSFASAWQNYLGNRINATQFKAEHQELISLAKARPEILIRVLQHLAAKQERIEAFLANLEQKLFDIGFPERAVTRIKNRLLRPRKVTIDEDELARLREIERNYQPNLAKRIEKSLQEIELLQRKLSDERERGDAIVRQASQGIMVLNKEGRILELNPVAQKVLGISHKEAKGRFLNDVIKAHHMLSVVSGWENETDKHIPKNVEIKAGDETVIDTIRESALVIEDENGRSIGGVSAIQDVVKYQDLEKRKNDILDVLGHDLRAPLNIVKQNIDLIADFVHQPDKIPVAEQVQFLDACKRHITRMEKMINKILDVRQLETGKIILKKDTVACDRLLEDAAHSLDSWAADKHIVIEIHSDPLPELHCDPERIYEVITNLISNALKFTPEGGRIDVYGRTVDLETGPGVEIAVRDSGIGINPEDLERIFDKYKQVSLHHPAGTSGLGLGLCICKTIIEMHNGSIWADSTLGQGSTFTFHIPLPPAEAG